MAYRKSLDFLPSVFQTKTNDKILKSSVDQLVSEPEIRELDGYIGRRFNPALSPIDSYIQEDYQDRQQYQLEPATVYTDKDGKIKFASNYVDLLNKIQDLGGNTLNPSRLFSADQYSYSGFFDFDKFVNYSNYYWLPNGPDSVDVFATEIPTDLDISVIPPENFGIIDGIFDSDSFDTVAFDTSTNTVTRLKEQGYTFDYTGESINPVIRLARGGSYRFNIEQPGHGFLIQTEPDLKENYAWQRNLSITDVRGVENNGEDVGTVTFNVPLKNDQDFFADMKKQAEINLLAYSTFQKRNLRFVDVQNINYDVFVSKHKGIDGQKNIDGKTIAFLSNPIADRVPQPWKPNTEYREYDLVVYANTIYRAITNFVSGRTFSTVNFERFFEDDDWYNPGLFDNSEVGFDGENFDRGEDIPVNEQLGWWIISVTDENIIKLTPVNSITENNKIEIIEGVNYGNRDIYRTSTNELELVPPITANLDTLYYRDSVDPNIVGVIEIVDQDNDLTIDVERVTQFGSYQSPNGVVFENGLKVKFIGNIIPESFKDREYYIEGVGTQIKLLPVENFDTPEPWLKTVSVKFDEDLFDSVGFDKSQPAPENKQYISINRASSEGSSWTRQNRWFHESVIENTNRYNQFQTSIDQSQRAKRPIIEFEPDLQLYNFGERYIGSVTVVDTKENDAFSNVEGIPTETVESVVSGYYSDGIPLVNGNRVVFANDDDLTVRSQIWRVEWITPESKTNEKTVRFTGDGESTVFDLNFTVLRRENLRVRINGQDTSGLEITWSIVGDQIVFSEAPSDQDSITVDYIVTQQIHLVKEREVQVGETILSQLGSQGQGVNWQWTGENWKQCQVKQRNNQAPLFELYDSEQINLSSEEKYVGTSFSGNQLFGYKIGSGFADSELGFSLSYRNIGNVGDILFEDFINTGTVSYEDVDENTKVLSTRGTTARKNSLNGYQYLNQWVKKSEKTKQYQVQTLFATVFQKNNFRLNVIPESILPNDIIVYVNNKPLTTRDFDIRVINGIGYLELVNSVNENDKIDIKVYKNQENIFGEWEIPSNYENNPKNEYVDDVTLGQLRNHIVETFVNVPGFSGEYQGKNNIKDLGNIKQFGGRIVQNAGSLHLANLFLNDQQANFFESLLYNMREYSRFKNKFLQIAANYPLSPLQPASSNIEQIISEMSFNKSKMFPFYYTDMIAYGDDYQELKFDILDPTIGRYFLNNSVDYSKASNKAVLVYLNGTQLVVGRDYTINNELSSIDLVLGENNDLLSVDDQLVIREYNNTDGSHIPQTPTKMGMYPAFIPQKVTEKYQDKVYELIRGHDGSYTVAFGDLRDDLLLELETRIYNNIKTEYKSDLLDVTQAMPGFFRENHYNYREINNILSILFSSWLGSTGLEINDNTEIFSNQPFSWNYNGFTDRISGNLFEQSNWRGLYKYFYDTDQPQLRPWEMLGFVNQPEWWEKSYGPAPYTSGNTILWEDLENGRIAAGKRQGIDLKYARPGLSKIIPVDSSGNLLSPYESLAKNSSNDITGEWRIGDIGPVENVWRQSSEYPYALQLVLALTKPAEYFGLYRNTENQISKKFGKESQWVFAESNTRNITEYVHSETVNGNVYRTSGYINWIGEYTNSLGLDITEAVGEKLRNYQTRLSYKVGGYTDKKYLKIYADQSTPNSTNSSVLIPDNDFDIKLIKSAPRTGITYSGVIVVNSGSGYVVRGYDQNKPYFVIESGSNNGNIKTVKSLNESYSVDSKGSGRLITVPYGTEFATKAEVVEFFAGLNRYQTSRGIIFNRNFDSDSSLGRAGDWLMSAEEFLFWTQQGWGENIAITLSPVGNKLNIRTNRGSVDTIANKPFGSRVLDKNFNIIESKNYTVLRDGRDFEIEILNEEGIYLADFDVVDYEHVIVFNNTTRFNDIIYQPELGSRQNRLKVVGFKTNDWDGTFGAAGFIINDDNVKSWISNKNYFKGEIVKFKEKYYVALENIEGESTFKNSQWSETEYASITNTLLPNLANKSGQPKSYYDFDKTNLELDADRLGKSLIGFEPRKYLNELEISDTSQVKFYQGLISQKGSNNSLKKMLRAKIDNFNGNTDFYEQWALRTGVYGSTENINQLKIPLKYNQSLKTPVVIELLNSNDEQKTGRYAYKQKDLIAYNRPYDKNFLLNRDKKSKEQDFKNCGFVQNNEVRYFSLNENNLLQSNILSLNDGERIWIADNSSKQWSVLRACDEGNTISTLTSNSAGETIVELLGNHSFSSGDLIFIKGQQTILANKIYKIKSVVDSRRILIDSNLRNPGTQQFTGRVLNFKNVHVNDVSDIENITPKKGWNNNDLIYIDRATDNGWAVYKKNNVFTSTRIYQDSEQNPADEFGTTVEVSRDGKYLFSSSPKTNTVKTFRRQLNGELVENTTLLSPNSNLDDFGTSITLSTTKYGAIGSPLSNDKGYVHVIEKNLAGNFIISQALVSPAQESQGKFGTSISISDDSNWLFVGQPGKGPGSVYAYQLITESEHTQIIQADGSTAVFNLDTELHDSNIYSIRAIVNGQLLTPFEDYVLVGETIQFTSSPAAGEIQIYKKDYYKFVTEIISNEIGNTEFGFSVVTSNDASQILIGSPGSGNKKGAVHVYNRTVEKQFVNQNQTTFSVSINQILGNPRVLVDDILQTENSDYNFNGVNSIQFNKTLVTGSVVTIESNNFIEVDTKTDYQEPQVGAQFGYSIDLCPFNCSLYIGSPFEDNDLPDSGRAYRYINQGRFFGTVTGTITNPVISENTKISINDFVLSFSTGQTLDDIIEVINLYGVPGVTASNKNNALKLDIDSAVFGDRMNFGKISGAFFNDVGIEIYVYQQMFIGPEEKEYSWFGKTVKIGPDASTLVIASERGSSTEVTDFDNGETVFDSGVTEFKYTKKQTGAVYVYQFLSRPESSVESPVYFALAEQLTPGNINQFDRFGNSISITNNTIFVGAPGVDDNSINDSGLVYGFTKESNSKTWNIIRQEQPIPDIQLLNKIYLYNRKTGEKLIDIDVIDPLQGKIAGVADQEISYITSYDPAVYSPGTNTTAGILWGEEYVGKVWWNTDSVKWADYRQDSPEYQASNWGFAFPGSRIVCAEWTKSKVPPRLYSDENNPDAYPLLDDQSFNVFVEYNNNLKRFEEYYYFWVAGKSTVPANNNRKISCQQIEEIISNPKLSGTPYAAFFDNNVFGLYNVDNFISDDTVLSIDYDSVINDNNIHSEYQLLSEDDISVEINDILLKKMFDSLSGEDISGNLVPDINLNENERYGILTRPRQSIFIDRQDALKEAVEYINQILIKIPAVYTKNIDSLISREPVPEITQYEDQVENFAELTYLNFAEFDIGYTVLVKNDENTKNRWVIYEKSNSGWTKKQVQNYNNSRYIEFVDWHDPETIVPESVDKVIDFEYNLQSVSAIDGEFVKIKNNGFGLFKIVQKQNNTWKTVAEQNGTLQIRSSLYDLDQNFQGFDNDGFALQLFDDWPARETQNILNAIYNDIFIENQQIEKNRWFLHMVKYALSKNKTIDWAFKTSFIKVDQTQRSLNQIPVFQRDNQDLILEYINEVKPYHSKISEFTLSYDRRDLSDLNITDFDLPAYYNFTTETYRSPTGQTVEDDIILDLEPYINWKENYTLELSGVDVYHSGNGYVETPVVNVVGGGGSGAKLRPIVINGKIDRIIVDNPGSGYITTPKIELDQNPSDPAILVPRLKNSKIRNFNTTVKFDRLPTTNGWLIQFKDNNGKNVSIKNEKLNRLNGNHSVVDSVIDLITNGSWITQSVSEANSFPVEGIPNIRVFNDDSGRIQVATNRKLNNLRTSDLQSLIRNLGTSVGLNNIDISGTVVVEDGSFVGYESDLLEWAPGVEYFQNEILIYNNTAYRVVSQFTASTQFDSSYLETVDPGSLQNHLNRTQAFYKPTAGMLGKDLGQLFQGIEFSGNKVKGAEFDLGSGFDARGFDTDIFDGTVTTSGSIEEIDTGLIDQTLYSKFSDTELGLRPEDIITHGGAFVDEYHSHAPEEMVPGSVFDSLKFTVHTLATNSALEASGYSPEFLVTSYTTDGLQRKFVYETNEHVGDYFIVYTQNTGPRYRKNSDSGQQTPLNVVPGSYYDIAQKNGYTVDFANHEIVFDDPLEDGDVLTIINIGQIGKSILADISFDADGETEAFLINIDASSIGESLVLINGVETTNYIFQQQENSTFIVFSTIPPAGTHIHVVISSATNRDPISKIYTQLAYLDGTNRTIELEEDIRRARSKDTAVIVELNGLRLRPGNTVYYTGDADKSQFMLPTTATENYTDITISEVQVWVDGSRQSVSDYDLNQASPGDVPFVVFNTAPKENADISITFTGEAEYFVDESNNTLRISNNVQINEGDLLAVTSFSDHDVYKIKTLIFKGTDQFISDATVTEGFDTVGFDSSEFDSLTVVQTLNVNYQIDEEQTVADRIFVSVDGRQLKPNKEYTLQNGSIDIADSILITQSTEIIVTWFDEKIYANATTFQIFKNIDETYEFNRVSIRDATTLARDLNITDSEIHLVDGSIVDSPSISTNTPGVIFINSERITYYKKDGNVLSQLRRGTQGTGAATLHESGSIVTNAGKSSRVPESDDIWYNRGVDSASDGTGIQSSETDAAKFLKQSRGIIPIRGKIQIGGYILEGYVVNGFVE